MTRISPTSTFENSNEHEISKDMFFSITKQPQQCQQVIMSSHHLTLLNQVKPQRNIEPPSLEWSKACR